MSEVERIDELELECGVTLHLRSVKQMIVLEFVGEAGGFEALQGNDPGTLRNFTRLLNYIAGWGVTNDVPADVKADFAMLGGGEFAARSRWVREMMTGAEMSQLFAQVLALTFKK